MDEDNDIHVYAWRSSEIILGAECFSVDVSSDEPTTVVLAADAPVCISVDPEDDTLLYVRRV